LKGVEVDRVLRSLVCAVRVAAHQEITLGDGDEVAIQRLGQSRRIGGSEAAQVLDSDIGANWLDACLADQVDHECCGDQE
jgi:hypothetical protein